MFAPFRRYLIVEDEAHSKDALHAMITSHCPDLEFAGWAADIETARKLIAGQKPDLVFLDVRLPDGTAFDLLQQGEPITFELIFTTAFEEYAVKAFRFSAADYLLKPINATEMITAVNKAREKRIAGRKNAEVETLLYNLSHTNLQSHRITIPTTHGVAFISVSEIVRFESDNSYSTLYLVNGKNMVACRSIGEFESMLNPYAFYRIHKSHLINMNQIKEYLRSDGGYIVMADGAKVEISRRRKDEFLDQLGFQA